MPWVYTYESVPNYYGLASMQAPSGGVISYTYGDSTRLAGRTAPYFTQLSRVVTTRSVGGPQNTNIPPGTWTFTYNDGPNKDQTIVDCPCGKTVYRYLGIGTDPNGDFEAWRTGLLAERQVFDPANQVVERERLTWRASERVSPDAVPAQSGIWSDPEVYNALLTRRVLERGPASWTAEYEYRAHLGTYNDFGLPFTITETGGGKTRATRHDFWYGGLFLAGRIEKTTVTVGAETVTSTATFAPGTGALASETVAGSTASFEYYANGNPRYTWDAHGHRTWFVSYSWGTVTETQTPLLTTYRQVAKSGQVTREQVGTLFTDFTYDLAFRPKRITPPNANPIEYTYDGLWDGWTRVGRGSGEVHTVVDGFGRPISSVNQVQQKTRLERDACGRVIFQALPYRNDAFKWRGVQTTYDVLGRVTKTRFTDGSPSGGPEASETIYSYNGLDVTMTDSLGRVTKREYLAIGGPAEAVLAAVVDAANQRTTYTYDIGNRLKTVGGAMPARNWTYDAGGQLIQETHPEAGSTTYTYDGGLLKTTTDAQGQVFTMTYDGNDRLVGRDGPGAASDVTLSYDTLGRVATQQSASVTTTFGYDAAGRRSRRTDLFQGQAYESLYGYDNNDNLTSITYPSGRVVGYTYDAENRLTGVTNDGAPFAGSFVYDDGGSLASYATGAVTHQWEFDIRQRVTRSSAGAGARPLDLVMGYNKENQVTSIDDPRYGLQTFQYDVLDRMTLARGPWGELRWGYDAAGNRTSEYHGGLMTFVYDANQRLTAFTTATGGEFFTYDALGRVTSDGRGTYTYTPSGSLATVTGTNISAAYTYDGDSARILRTVNGHSVYSLRSPGGQVLSEYESACGSPAWTRDIVYAGSRALGAIKAPSSLPTIALTTGVSSVAEGAGNATVTVRLTTPNGLPTTCAASVSYRSVTHAGEAARGPDFGGVASALSFPAGTASGATQTIVIAVKQDAIYEGQERFSIDLTGATGAQLAAASHIVTIVDDDALPSLTINNVTVTEGPSAQAVFTLTLSAASAVQTEVNYITSPESAKTNIDYATTAGRAIIPAGSTQVQVAVPILDDSHAEIPETFTLQLSSPLNATLGTTFGRATINDNEPRTPIDPTYPGLYFPDLTTNADTSTFVAIFNPHAVAVTARLTFTRPNGTGTTRDVAVPALSRITVDLLTEPGIGLQGDVSAVVQSLDAARPLVSEASSYWLGGSGTVWRGGTSSRGAQPISMWYFAEGGTGAYDEYLTIYNPSNQPVNAVVTVLTSGTPQQFVFPIESGPGRIKVRLNDYLPPLEHAITVAGLSLAGAPVAITAERTTTWFNGDRRDGHNSLGTSGAWLQHYLAEGATGAFSTYLPVANPNATAATILVHYLHQNGTEYTQSETIPGYSRITLTPAGAGVPAGNFAIHAESTNGVGFMLERVMYGGAGWTYGHAEGSSSAAYTGWRFAEGAVNSFFSTFLLLGNPSATAATVTLTFRLEAGGTVTWPVSVPARGRTTVDLNGIPGLTGTFATEVAVTNGVPIVAERAMYWPSSWDGAHVSRGRPW